MVGRQEKVLNSWRSRMAKTNILRMYFAWRFVYGWLKIVAFASVPFKFTCPHRQVQLSQAGILAGHAWEAGLTVEKLYFDCVRCCSQRRYFTPTFYKC